MDDYVECAECGHPLERHYMHGCTIDECTCTESWKLHEIEDIRARHSLPRKFRRENF